MSAPEPVVTADSKPMPPTTLLPIDTKGSNWKVENVGSAAPAAAAAPSSPSVVPITVHRTELAKLKDELSTVREREQTQIRSITQTMEKEIEKEKSLSVMITTLATPPSMQAYVLTRVWL